MAQEHCVNVHQRVEILVTAVARRKVPLGRSLSAGGRGDALGKSIYKIVAHTNAGHLQHVCEL